MSKSHLIIHTLVLVPIFAGCQPGEQVTVSGAVAKPGTYVYQPDRSANSYLKGAGGLTEEALLDSAYLVRGLVDSSGKEIIKSVTIPLSKHPKVLPDDEIKVPVRVYDVRLDTVRVLRNVRLVHESRIFKISTGALVSGWTERGVLVALLLGRGKVYEIADTSKAVWAFHYLYVHLHPDEYGRLTGFTGDVIDSLEALEDAHAIHTRTRTQLDYVRPGGLQLPDTGYWRVLLGILLTPRSASFPGSGLRRRRFEDGRVWTTFPNGRQRWQHPDGRVEVTFPGGAKETRFPDGRVVSAYEQLVSRLKDESAVRNGVAGGAMEERASERATEISAGVIPDGTIVTRQKGGNEPAIQPDGYMIVKGVDGSIRETFPDGRILHRSGTGYQVEIFPDGREIESNRFGQKITSWPDGRKEVRMPAAYSYPGPLRTDLAVVNPLPDSVAVGEELTVTGQLHSEVEDISISTFLAPDGNVIKGNVRRRGRRFQARFRFGEVGHCRVQVQVVLPKARTFTVSHQAVVVGNPEKLEDEVLTIAPYLGDEAAEQFLIDEINAARRRIGRQAVLPHPNLMHVARIRLEEMLALGEVSHFSFGGLDVMWHVTTRRLPFFQVSENVANGHFVETMQAGWMLSAGHRSNILARHWTHVGVAVAKDRDLVWGVQVFARQ
ncbi:MAG: SLBB domain-containing protein [Gemmatimonadetes bacterium]|nr:SLBB domain-containing protein [Gemmatimonadota bacterium]